MCPFTHNICEGIHTKTILKSFQRKTYIHTNICASTHTHAHTQTRLIKPPTLNKLTCQLSLVHYKTYRLHRDQSITTPLQNSKAVRERVCLRASEWGWKKVEKMPVADIVCLPPDFQRQPKTQQSLTSMNKNSEWQSEWENGRGREAHTHTHTMALAFVWFT